MSTACSMPFGEQSQSRLFTLPSELRNAIYKTYFISTMLSRGMGGFAEAFDPDSVESPKAEPYDLSVLRTCQLARREIGDSWLKQVLFDFNRCETMLDIPTQLDRETLSKLRHVKVGSKTLILNLSDSETSKQYRLAAVFTLLPGLRLDVLSIHDHGDRSASAEVAYETLDELITSGRGWKELHFLSASAMLTGSVADTPFEREPQQSHWRRTLQDRDGAQSGSSVQVFRAKQASGHWSDVLDSSRCEPFMQTDSLKGTDYDTPFGESEKAMLVLVKRGKGIEYVSTSSAINEDQDIWRDTGVHDWPTIKASFIDAWPEPDPGEFGDYGDYGDYDIHDDNGDNKYELDDYDEYDG